MGSKRRRRRERSLPRSGPTLHGRGSHMCQSAGALKGGGIVVIACGHELSLSLGERPDHDGSHVRVCASCCWKRSVGERGTKRTRTRYQSTSIRTLLVDVVV